MPGGYTGGTAAPRASRAAARPPSSRHPTRWPSGRIRAAERLGIDDARRPLGHRRRRPRVRRDVRAHDGRAVPGRAGSAGRRRWCCASSTRRRPTRCPTRAPRCRPGWSSASTTSAPALSESGRPERPTDASGRVADRDRLRLAERRLGSAIDPSQGAVAHDHHGQRHEPDPAAAKYGASGEMRRASSAAAGGGDAVRSETPFSHFRASGVNSPTSRLREPVIMG